MSKTPIFIFSGTVSKPIYLIFYTFLSIKKTWARYFGEYIFFYTRFFTFLTFFAFDSTRQNRELVLTKGRLSTSHPL